MEDFISESIDVLLETLKHTHTKYIFLPTPSMDTISSEPSQKSKSDSFEKPLIDNPRKASKEPIVKSEPVSQPEEVIVEKKQKLPLEEIEAKPIKSIYIDELKDFKELFHNKFPQILIYDAPLNDAKAKKVKNAWKHHIEIPHVVFLYRDPTHKEFLNNVAKAVSLLFMSSKAMNLSYFDEESKTKELLNHPHLKLIIAPDDVVVGLSSFTPYYKELPQQKKRFLKDIPLLFLPDISLYFKDPKLKASLWKLLCRYLHSLTA